MGEADAARAAYERAVESESASIRAHVGLQELMRARGRDLDLRRFYRAFGNPVLTARLEGASTVRREALERSVEPYRSLGLAQLAYDTGALKDTERQFRRAVAMDPGQPWGWIGLGRVQLTLRKYGLAHTSFQHAVACAPSEPHAWYGLSLAAQRLGQREEAYAAAGSAVVLAPLDPAVVRRFRLAAQHLPERAQRLVAAGTLAGIGRGVSADAMLAAAEMYTRAGATLDVVGSALADARRLGALQVELEAAVAVVGDSDIAAFIKRFARGIDARYRHYRGTGEAETLEQLLAWARQLYEETTGETLDSAGSIESFAFVGKLMDPSEESDEPLVRRLAERGVLLILGQRAGGPPEAMLTDIVRRSGLESVTSRGVTVEREAIWIGQRYVSGYVEWAGGGDLAGLALGSVVLVDLHASAGWEGSIRRRLKQRRPFAAAALAQRALDDHPVDHVDDPAGVADRLLLETDIDLASEVLVHENAHLIDAKRFLPKGGNLLRGFGLALKHGFAAEKVVAFLERNAQLAAIAEGQHPRAALAICCASLGGHGVHASGYREIVQAMVKEILDAPERYTGIDRDRVVVQQLHRLTDDEIRELARTLTRQWDS